MDYDVDDTIFAYELEQDDLFRYDGEDYKAYRISDDGDYIAIRAEVLTDNDDYVTLELEPDSKIELLIVV